MPDVESKTSSSAATDSPAEAGASTQPAPKRFDIFIVDIGWDSPAATALRKNLDFALRYQTQGNVYILSRPQCVQLLKSHPSMIGSEPSIIIIDREAYAAGRPQGFGFKLNLGMVRDAQCANGLLKWILAVLAEQTPGSDITEPIRTVIHKDGWRGAIDIAADIMRSPMGETATH